ncbi:hypothetical protein [Longimicrobium sp.]|uniref:hypothetical protein n=1 Tax=Longimicrobium sp. TaxID=2029185 RepID=UPI003B3A8DFF
MKFGRINRALFGIATLGVLAFGASSIVAQPAEGAAKGQCRPKGCRDACIASGAQGGVCNYMDQSCDCIY